MPWLLMMKRPGYRLTKSRAIRVRTQHTTDNLIDECCLQLVNVQVNGRPVLTTIGNIPMPQLGGLDRKVGEGLFRSSSTRQHTATRRNQLYDQGEMIR